MDKKIIKTIRLSDKDSALVESFLNSNPGIDFSTLMRLALYKFLKDPTFEKPTYKSIEMPEAIKEFH